MYQLRGMVKHQRGTRASGTKKQRCAADAPPQFAAVATHAPAGLRVTMPAVRLLRRAQVWRERGVCGLCTGGEGRVAPQPLWEHRNNGTLCLPAGPLPARHASTRRAPFLVLCVGRFVRPHRFLAAVRGAGARRGNAARSAPTGSARDLARAPPLGLVSEALLFGSPGI